MTPGTPLPDNFTVTNGVPHPTSDHHSSSVSIALDELSAGRPVILLGGEHDDQTGQLIFPSQIATPEMVAFTVRHSSGILCTPMTEADCDRLNLPAMNLTKRDGQPHFAISVDGAGVESTGISAVDRANTINALAGSNAHPADFTRPGHVFPIRTADGGVLINPAHDEAAVDLTRLAGFRPVAASATLVNDDGTISRPGQLRRFAEQHDLQIVTITDLIAYRLAQERHVERKSTTKICREQGEFTVITYSSKISPHQIAALVRGDISELHPVIRQHNECTHGALFEAPLCVCAAQLDAHLRATVNGNSGVLIYISRTDAHQPTLLERLQATTTAELSWGDPGGPSYEDRHLHALTNQILRDIGVIHVPAPTHTHLMSPPDDFTWASNQRTASSTPAPTRT